MTRVGVSLSKFRVLKLPHNTCCRLCDLLRYRRRRRYYTLLLGDLGGRVAVHVEPRAAENELHMVREVQNGRDECQAEDEEEDGVYIIHGVSRHLEAGG